MYEFRRSQKRGFCNPDKEANPTSNICKRGSITKECDTFTIDDSTRDESITSSTDHSDEVFMGSKQSSTRAHNLSDFTEVNKHVQFGAFSSNTDKKYNQHGCINRMKCSDQEQMCDSSITDSSDEELDEGISLNHKIESDTMEGLLAYESPAEYSDYPIGCTGGSITVYPIEDGQMIHNRLNAFECDMDYVRGQLDGIINLLRDVFNVNNKIHDLIESKFSNNTIVDLKDSDDEEKNQGNTGQVMISDFFEQIDENMIACAVTRLQDTHENLDDTSYVPYCVNDMYTADDNKSTLINNHLDMVVSLPGVHDGDLLIYPFGHNSDVKLSPMNLCLSFSCDDDQYGLCDTEISEDNGVCVMKVLSLQINNEDVRLEDLTLPITFRYDGYITM